MWPKVSGLEHFKAKFPSWKPKDLETEFPQLDSEALDLLRKMLVLHPGSRISARKALEHAYFKDIIDSQ